jgi:hypothetical protein
MRELTNYAASVQIGSNVVAFETVYIVTCQDLSGQVQERQFRDVAAMLRCVRLCQSLPDSVDVTVTRYKQIGLDLSNAAQVCRHLRPIVPSPARYAVVSGGQDVFEFVGNDVFPVPYIGTMLGDWRTIQDWPIRSAGITGPVSFMDEREQILTNKKARISEFVGNKYRETIPVFSMDTIDDLSVLDTIQGAKNMVFEYVNEDGETVQVCWNALNTNFWRKYADRFDSRGYDGANIRDIAASIFTEAWLESRQTFPDQWIAITYRERYVGKIYSQRYIQAKINAGHSYNNSEEWKGRERVRKDTDCETRDGFIVLLSSYAVARAIQEIVQPFKMEYSDMAQLKASKVDAITLENREILTTFEQEVCKLLMTDHTEREAAEHLGVERTKIRQAKMRIKVKMEEFMPD